MLMDFMKEWYYSLPELNPNELGLLEYSKKLQEYEKIRIEAGIK